MENSDFIRETRESYASQVSRILSEINQRILEEDYQDAIAWSSGLQASLGVLLLLQELQMAEEAKQFIKDKNEEES